MNICVECFLYVVISQLSFSFQCDDVLGFVKKMFQSDLFLYEVGVEVYIYFYVYFIILFIVDGCVY